MYRVPINSRWANCGVLAIVAAMGGPLTVASQAGTIDWAAAVNGSFQDTTKWVGGVVPSNTTSDIAQFNVAGTYTVTYAAAAATNAINAYDGDVTLDLVGFKHSLGATGVNGAAGVSGLNNPHLTIVNGTVKMERTGGGAPAVVVGGNVAGETGKLTISTGGILDLGARGSLAVGQGQGAGTVEVINGGKIYSSNITYLGYALAGGADNTSTVTVSGKGSALDVWSGMNIGIYNDQNVVVNVTGGAYLAGMNTTIGKDSPISTTSVVTISGKDGDGVSSQLQIRNGPLLIKASGTLNINNGGVLTVGGGTPTTTVSAGGTLNLGGDATVSSKGLVTINGNLNVSHLKNQFVSTALTMGATSDLNIILAADGANQADAYLNVGTMTLSTNGIDVLLDTGYSPIAGDMFNLLDWTTLNGGPLTIANVELPTLADGLSWDTSLLGTTGVISVVPEPGTMGLLGLAGLYLIRSRRSHR